MGVGLALILLLGLIILNGLFSMSETALVSARKARLQEQAEAGDTNARAALDLSGHPDQFLSTVQIFITLIGVLAGAFGEKQLSSELAPVLERIGIPRSYSPAASGALVVLGITYLSLIIGELVPKRLALNNAEGVAAMVARPMQLFSKLTHPFVVLLSISTNTVLRLFGARASDEPPVTEDEVRILIAQGTQFGVFEETERRILERVFRLGDKRVSNIMTPRTEVVCLDVEDSPDENRQKILEANHSILPLCAGGPDTVLGLVALRHLCIRSPHALGNLTAEELQANAIPPLAVPETLSAFRLLELFKERKQHMALVVDEFGSTAGLVTLHDVLEALVGEVPTQEEQGDLPAVQREDGSWLLDGLLSLDDAEQLLGVRNLRESTQNYTTLGGLVMEQLGRIPSVGDNFLWDGWRFEVVDMDGNRVDKVWVARQPE